MLVKIEANFKKGPKQDTYDTLHPPTHPLTHFFNIQPQLTYTFSPSLCCTALAPQNMTVIFNVLKMVSYIKEEEKEDSVLYLLNVC